MTELAAAINSVKLDKKSLYTSQLSLLYRFYASGSFGRFFLSIAKDVLWVCSQREILFVRSLEYQNAIQPGTFWLNKDNFNVNTIATIYVCCLVCSGQNGRLFFSKASQLILHDNWSSDLALTVQQLIFWLVRTGQLAGQLVSHPDAQLQLPGFLL